MVKSLVTLKERFGEAWEKGLDQTLEAVSGGDIEKLEQAVIGYVRFSLETTKLQQRFVKEGHYLSQSQRDTAKEVFDDSEYMFSTSSSLIIEFINLKVNMIIALICKFFINKFRNHFNHQINMICSLWLLRWCFTV